MTAKQTPLGREDPLLAADLSDPWRHRAGEPARHLPDYDLLGQLLTRPVRAERTTTSGRFARAIDAWIAHELRRAGFDYDEVWPRPALPRVMPREIALLLDALPANLRGDLLQRIAALPSVAPADARILGRAYEKQVDVVVASWQRGPEILVSTKSQVSSFAKNLANRFEEAYGDAGNLRGRYCLAALGFFFVQRSTVRDAEPAAFERAVDMVRKLRDLGDRNGYTATALLLVEWDDAEMVVRARPDLVPADVAPPRFFTTMIDWVLAVTPVGCHPKVRELRERRAIPLSDEPPAGRDRRRGLYSLS